MHIQFCRMEKSERRRGYETNFLISICFFSHPRNNFFFSFSFSFCCLLALNATIRTDSAVRIKQIEELSCENGSRFFRYAYAWTKSHTSAVRPNQNACVHSPNKRFQWEKKNVLAARWIVFFCTFSSRCLSIVRCIRMHFWAVIFFTYSNFRADIKWNTERKWETASDWMKSKQRHITTKNSEKSDGKTNVRIKPDDVDCSS